MPGCALAYGIFMLYLHRACRLFSDGLPYQTQGRLKNSIPPGQISLSDYRMNTQKLIGYALGPLGSAAASAIALPLISWYFSAEDIGRIVLLQTVAGMVLLVMGLDWIRLTFANIMPQKTNRLYLKISSSCPWP